MLEAAQRSPQPWKNGGGTTTEIAREGERERWTWRVSIAAVERPGPFSDFAGYERTIMLLRGDGMVLDIGGRVVRLERHEPFTFDGAAPTEGRLAGGAVQDLNLIVDRARAHGGITVRRESFDIDAAWALLVALDGAVSVACGASAHRLAPGDALRLDDARGRVDVVAIEPHAAIADIRIHRRE